MIHAFTIDVEDYHNILARDWRGIDGPPTRAVVTNTHRLLERLAEHATRATFFTLGEVAETFPELIREIASGGHELGVHGYYHRQVFKLTADSFRKEVVDAKHRIEDLTGAPVEGHRAPAFSIMPETRWALEVLADAGFKYDSSIFPIRGRRYGWPGFPLDIHERDLAGGRRIIEAPLSTVSVLSRRLPACGGGYLRHFPGFVTRWAMSRVQRERPAIVYMHPYEIETTAPAVDVSGLDPIGGKRLRRFDRLQHRNRSTVDAKIVDLLKRHQFGPLREVIATALASQNSRAGLS